MQSSAWKTTDILEVQPYPLPANQPCTAPSLQLVTGGLHNTPICVHLWGCMCWRSIIIDVKPSGPARRNWRDYTVYYGSGALINYSTHETNRIESKPGMTYGVLNSHRSAHWLRQFIVACIFNSNSISISMQQKHVGVWVWPPDSATSLWLCYCECDATWNRVSGVLVWGALCVFLLWQPELDTLKDNCNCPGPGLACYLSHLQSWLWPRQKKIQKKKILRKNK